MRLLSWIFQPVYLLFLLILAVFYLYREEVMPEHRDIEQSRSLIERMEQSVVAIKEPGVVLSSAAPDAGISAAINEPPQQIIADTKVHQPLNSTQPIIVMAPSVDAALDVVVDTRASTERPVSGVGESRASESDQVRPSRPLEVADRVEPTKRVTPPGPVAPTIDETTETTETLGKLWYAARAAAWGGRYEEAVAHYLQLTSSYPESADGFGELGNIYYAGGDLEAALGAYRQALNIYQRTGNRGPALQLQRVIAGIQQSQSRR